MQSKEAACVTEQPTVRLTGQTHLHDFVGQRAQRRVHHLQGQVAAQDGLRGCVGSGGVGSGSQSEQRRVHLPTRQSAALDGLRSTQDCLRRRGMARACTSLCSRGTDSRLTPAMQQPARRRLPGGKGLSKAHRDLFVGGRAGLRAVEQHG